KRGDVCRCEIIAFLRDDNVIPRGLDPVLYILFSPCQLGAGMTIGIWSTRHGIMTEVLRLRKEKQARSPAAARDGAHRLLNGAGPKRKRGHGQCGRLKKLAAGKNG